jgi:LysM repeat protein
MSDEVEAWEDDRDGGMGHLGDIDAVEPSATSHPTSVGIDPLIARLGGLAVIVTLLVAAVGAIGSGGDPADQVTVTAGGVPVATPSTVATSAPPTSADATAPASRPAPSSPRNTASSQAPTASIDAAPTQTIPPTIAVAAGLLAEADPTPCGAEYVIVAGDFWIRLADAADVRLSDLLAVNGATVDTALHPGRSICLPVGASTPAPPPVTTTTVARPSTTAPVGTVPAPAPATTQPPARPAPRPVAPAPSTTAAPTPPSASATPAQAGEIIRSVWPDDLEDRALEIAWRESNHLATAKNSCCYGLFQIHWNAHRSWLGELGITSPTQLFDPTLNARAALTLYVRAGGWGPWGF